MVNKTQHVFRMANFNLEINRNSSQVSLPVSKKCHPCFWNQFPKNVSKFPENVTWFSENQFPKNVTWFLERRASPNDFLS